ncbi:response regulator transcription factor [Leeuwenhoekiella polynyae]|uniref:DNA-binding response OmpR family regulator n=1 Tax=Leeuwenhoekiella polynyae TaxID=1550906 RepID=A0A4Q0PHV2_9FLAO|nr:response regulator transcription factor [Leeuwenhoekiella polynyae]RXG26250.1 DNA-binding response OmpR family regulator [Leeuwenhoekiella polynyae]
MNKILLVEDDTSLGYLLQEYLTLKGFDITLAKTTADALKNLKQYSYDLIVLDVMLPDGSGFDLAQKIKLQHSTIPFLFLTSRSLKIDVLKGFSLGAVDYLKKPLDEEELVVRLNTLLARIKQPSKGIAIDQELRLGGYTLNTLNSELVFEGHTTRLTTREFELLLFLVTHKGQLCSHKEILTSIWGKNDYFNRKSLNVYISRLRKYLNNDPTLKIENLHTRGFMLSESEQSPT